MSTIQVNTVQNVPIEYELASLRYRILAYAVDQILLLSAFLIAVWTFGIMFRSLSDEVVMLFIFLPLYLFYIPSMEILNNGKTLGKMLLKIRVLKCDGTVPATGDYLLRWIFRLPDIALSLGIVASVSVASSRNNQRIGGYLSDTLVIRVKPKHSYSLDDIMRLSRDKGDALSFPLVSRFEEADMLLVKETLERFEKYPGENSQKALDEITATVAKVIEHGPEKIKDKERFLRSVIRDYVTATR